MIDGSVGSALIGGALIGLAASLVLLGLGRIAGVSGMVSSLLSPRRGETGWRLAFVAGLLLAGWSAARLSPEHIGSSPRAQVVLVFAGLLVGFGTRLGSGCTSGHGVCGVSRLSPRSLVATLVFILTGIATVAASRWLGMVGT